MDEVQIKSNGNNYVCDECKNENTISEEKKIKDIVECEFCGIEYTLIDQDESENFTLEMLEEEK
ncbi:hypothetical protein GF362_02345 [Candidatus Dojkabacteria bacterium]|nr:hypothetical protein [Candidatus Dojkabacteria bacterium]